MAGNPGLEPAPKKRTGTIRIPVIPYTENGNGKTKEKKERYNPFTKDGKTRPGDRTPSNSPGGRP